MKYNQIKILLNVINEKKGTNMPDLTNPIEYYKSV